MSEKEESCDSCVCTLSSVGHTLLLDASVSTCSICGDEKSFFFLRID